MRRFRFYGRVLGHAVWFSGWVAGLVTVIYGGSVAAGFLFLRHYHHHTWAVAIVGAGAALAILEGAHRVWDPLDRELQATKARLCELDTPEAKRAYLNQQIARARQMQRRAGELTDDQWHGAIQRTLEADLVHWENKVRADLASDSFPTNMDIAFDSNRGMGIDAPAGFSPRVREGYITYLDWRVTRLEQIRDGKIPIRSIGRSSSGIAVCS